MRVPEWMRSIRFRLAILYSGVLFGLASIVVCALYFGLQARIWTAPLEPAVASIEPG